MGDSLGGAMTALGVLVSLLYRERTGQGQWLDTALYEVVARFLEHTIPAYDKLGEVRTRMGNATPGVAPSNSYQTGDGKWLLLTAPNDRLFGNLARAIGRPDLIDDPRFQTNPKRAENAELLDSIIADWMAQRSQREAIQVIEAADVPVSAIYTVADMFEDPHYRERGSIVEVNDPTIGPVKMPCVVPRLSLTPGRVERGGPRLGEYNEEVYCGLLGYAKEELAQLRAEGII